MPLREVGPDMDSVDWSKNVVLDTKDSKKLEVSRDGIKMSRLVHDLLSDSDEGQEMVVPLPEVDAETLQCIWEYLEHYQGQEPEKLEKPLKDELKNLVPEWDWKYITTSLLEAGDEKKHEKLFLTLKGANFMNIEPLRDLCCAAIANMLRGKNEQEILDLFGITEPFTPEEEEKLYQEYEWLREKKD
eukprot:TRINITY_DN1291_c0_g1_i4.p1 TRINITY_DN1291_c0_g1~~TRINITY_DN1291_c0_g1_i4.p1  ORF type:complete len:215 (+),score=117.48 TRINITY_DN1291_c0_g1_i4:87-647(+)